VESGDTRKVILASTASAFKFPGDVCKSLEVEVESEEPAALIAALEGATNEEAPAQLTRTLSLPVRFERSVDKEDMAKFVFGDI
jgi:threonine synthase